AEERDRAALAVKIAGKVEDEGFEQRRAIIVHRRTAAKTGNAIVKRTVRTAQANRVDAVQEIGPGGMRHVRSRKAKLAAQFLAVADFRHHGIAIAKKPCRLRNIAFRQKPANPARRDDTGPFVTERLDEADAKTSFRAPAHEKVGRALTVL